MAVWLLFFISFFTPPSSFSFFFFNDTATTEIYTLSLHDALPILTHVAQALELPGLAGVRREKHPATVHQVIAEVRLAAPDPHKVRVRRRESDGADRSRRLVREHRVPGVPAVRRLPHAAGRSARVVGVRVSRDAGHGGHPPAPDRRAEVAELEVVERVGALSGGSRSVGLRGLKPRAAPAASLGGRGERDANGQHHAQEGDQTGGETQHCSLL